MRSFAHIQIHGKKLMNLFVFYLHQTDPLSPLFDEENNRKNV